MQAALRIKKKQTRKMQLQYSRGYVSLQLFKPYYFINYVFSIQVRMICLSLLPPKFRVKRYKNEMPGRAKLQKLIQDFKNILQPLTNSKKQPKVGQLFSWWRKTRFPIIPAKTTAKKTRKSSKAKSKVVLDDQISAPEISQIEYQILFGALLSLIGFQIRVLWKLDIQHLRSKGYIKITAAAKEKKKQQKKRQKQAIYKAQFSSDDQLEQVKVKESPRRNLNDILSQSEYKSPNLIRSGASDQESSEDVVLTKAKTRGQKKKITDTKKKTNTKKSTQKIIERSQFRPFFQIFDANQDHWWTLDLASGEVWEDMKGIKQYFQQFGYLIAVGGLKHNMELPQFPPHPNPYLIYMQDLTLNAVNNPRETVRQRNTFILHSMIQKTIGALSSWKCVLFCKNPPLKWALLQEQQKLEELEKSVHPKTLAEFRYSPYYVLASQISKYQGLLPQSQPVEGLTYRDEPVFLRSEVVELHSADRWKKFGRQVRAGEKPIKKVKSVFNPQKLILMYGAWQTEKFTLKVTNGKIPVGDYGNFEMFNVKKLPQELEHVVVDRAAMLAKKLKIEYAPCVTSFDIQHGRYVPVKKGVVVFKKDAPALRQAYAEYMQKEDKRAGERSLKEGKKLWNELIRKILVRKYMSSKYDDQN